ncbi:MAG: Hsp20 family protein [Candidatus Omnitrophica bacterium]|nr:Hsp20 family protein [Candidatus Omnitrophota bacterium]
MLKPGRILLMGVFLVGVVGAAHAASDEDVAALKKQVAELQAKVVVLEKKLIDSNEPAGDPLAYELMDPFSEMRAMQQQMDALMGTQFGGYGPARGRGFRAVAPQITFNPDYDMKETDKAYVITFDMPGMDKSKINVEIKNGVLVISGERLSESKESQGNKVYRQERSFGYFSRVIPLPKNAKADSVQAKYDNGVLIVTVDKKEVLAPKAEEQKKIEVK